MRARERERARESKRERKRAKERERERERERESTECWRRAIVSFYIVRASIVSFYNSGLPCGDTFMNVSPHGSHVLL